MNKSGYTYCGYKEKKEMEELLQAFEENPQLTRALDLGIQGGTHQLKLNTASGEVPVTICKRAGLIFVIAKNSKCVDSSNYSIDTSYKNTKEITIYKSYTLLTLDNLFAGIPYVEQLNFMCAPPQLVWLRLLEKSLSKLKRLTMVYDEKDWKRNWEDLEVFKDHTNFEITLYVLSKKIGLNLGDIADKILFFTELEKIKRKVNGLFGRTVVNHQVLYPKTNSFYEIFKELNNG